MSCRATAPKEFILLTEGFETRIENPITSGLSCGMKDELRKEVGIRDVVERLSRNIRTNGSRIDASCTRLSNTHRRSAVGLNQDFFELAPALPQSAIERR